MKYVSVAIVTLIASVIGCTSAPIIDKNPDLHGLSQAGKDFCEGAVYINHPNGRTYRICFDYSGPIVVKEGFKMIIDEELHKSPCTRIEDVPMFNEETLSMWAFSIAEVHR
jgi:hypothetical protein